MIQAVEPQGTTDVHLQVIDLNLAAIQWYRSLGFFLLTLTKSVVGKASDSNMIVYLEMKWDPSLAGATLEKYIQTLPPMIKGEVLNEAISITYPDKPGVLDVEIVGYDGSSRLHFVSSSGLSFWDGDEFTDEVDLNNFFRSGRVKFKRPLSVICRNNLLLKRSQKQAKVDDLEEARRQEERTMLEEAMKVKGPLTRQRRRPEDAKVPQPISPPLQLQGKRGGIDVLGIC